MGDVTQCRLWLPRHLCSTQQDRSLALLGWINGGLQSLDFVVVTGVPTCENACADFLQLQRILDAAATKLPWTLQNEQNLRVIGEYLVPHESDQLPKDKSKSNYQLDGCSMLPGYEISKGVENAGAPRISGGSENIGNFDVVRDTKENRPDNSQQRVDCNKRPMSNVWAVLSGCIRSGDSMRSDWIPNIHSITRNGFHLPIRKHIIIYNEPKFGSHHFSCLPWTFPHEIINLQKPHDCNKSSKKPLWLAAIDQQQKFPNMEVIMTELNCAVFINETVKALWLPAYSTERHPIRTPIYQNKVWHPVHVFVAVWATGLYCLARVLALGLNVSLRAAPFLQNVLHKSMTWQTMHIRCQQLMAWPFNALWGGLGPEQPNVDAAHRVAFAKHSTWFSVLIDKFVGAIVGYLVLSHHALISQSVVKAGQSLTNDVLRTGCVWLMGVPAGFKINTELAATFGTLSLHWIQTWSTLLYTLIPALGVFLRVLGLTGILLGFTVPAAMVSDVISASTIHVKSLHHTVAFIYSNQLRALAALWRLFRGRKRNILRRRLDTFDCSVEQLVVGSLMFTPLLLLLPTTSVFYTFFSIIFFTLSSIQLILHYIIFFFLSFPFCLVGAWLMQPKQFPSGVVMVSLSRDENEKSKMTSPFSKRVAESSFPPMNLDGNRITHRMEKKISGSPIMFQEFVESSNLEEAQVAKLNLEIGPEESEKLSSLESTWSSGAEHGAVLLTSLGTRSATLGELFIPFLRNHFIRPEWSSGATLAYKLVTGERYVQNVQFGGLAPLPHTPVSLRVFAKLCYTAVGAASGFFLSNTSN